MSILEFPNEIFDHIFLTIEIQDEFNLAQVCKRFFSFFDQKLYERLKKMKLTNLTTHVEEKIENWSRIWKINNGMMFRSLEKICNKSIFFLAERDDRDRIISINKNRFILNTKKYQVDIAGINRSYNYNFQTKKCILTLYRFRERIIVEFIQEKIRTLEIVSPTICSMKFYFQNMRLPFVEYIFYRNMYVMNNIKDNYKLDKQISDLGFRHLFTWNKPCGGHYYTLRLSEEWTKIFEPSENFMEKNISI